MSVNPILLSMSLDDDTCRVTTRRSDGTIDEVTLTGLGALLMADMMSKSIAMLATARLVDGVDV